MIILSLLQQKKGNELIQQFSVSELFPFEDIFNLGSHATKLSDTETTVNSDGAKCVKEKTETLVDKDYLQSNL